MILTWKPAVLNLCRAINTQSCSHRSLRVLWLIKSKRSTQKVTDRLEFLWDGAPFHIVPRISRAWIINRLTDQSVVPQLRHQKHLLILRKRSNNGWHTNLFCIHYIECSAHMCQTSGCYYVRHFEWKLVHKFMTYHQPYGIKGILMYVKGYNRKFYNKYIFYNAFWLE